MMKLTQWVIASVLTLWGAIAFMVLCGEDAPGHPMSLTVFFVSKGLAVLNLWACYRIGKYAYNKGYMPDYFNITEEDD